MVDDRADRWWSDDDQLLSALDQAIHPAEDVPDGFVRTALACFVWAGIDADLAALAYDSAVDLTELANTRAESAQLRALTFEAADLTFELEVTPDGLAGQVIPAHGGELQLQLSDGTATTVRLTEHGYFRIRPTPVTPFWLRYRFADGRTISTDLIVL